MYEHTRNKSIYVYTHQHEYIYIYIYIRIYVYNKNIYIFCDILAIHLSEESCLSHGETDLVKKQLIPIVPTDLVNLKHRQQPKIVRAQERVNSQGDISDI